MLLPPSQKFLTALQDYRKAHKIRRSEVWKEWQKLRQRHDAEDVNLSEESGDGKDDSAFRNLLAGKTRLKYDDVNDLLIAHGIRCFDLFIDECLPVSFSELAWVMGGDRHPMVRGSGKLWSVDPEFLTTNRTKIDWVHLEPGKSTEWAQHSGHEFVLIGQVGERGHLDEIPIGDILAEFQELPEGPIESKLLREYDGVAFPSMLRHRFTNRSNVKAVIVAARPTNAKVRE